MRIGQKITASLIITAILAVGTIGLISYFNTKAGIEGIEINSLKSTARLKADIIEGFFSDATTSIKVAQDFFNIKTNLPIVAQFFDSPDNPEYISAKNTLDSQIVPERTTLGLINILLFDPNGRIVYEANPEYIGSSKFVPEIFQSSFLKGKEEISISDIFPDPGKNEQFNSLVTAPVIVDGKFIGVIGFIEDAGELYSLIQDVTGLGETGETLLVKKMNGHLLYLNPLRYDPSAALKKSIEIGSREALPAQEAAAGRSGSGISIDYRGQQVIAVWFPLADLSWGFVAKIDTKEAFAPIYIIRNLIILSFMVLVFLIVVVSFFVTRSISGPLKKLQEGSRIIGGGNLDYRVEIEGENEIADLAREFNKMAGELKGARSDLEGKIDARTRELRQVRDALLNIAEDLEVEKKKIDEARVKDESILGSIGEGLLVIDKGGVVSMTNQAAGKMLGYDAQEIIGMPILEVLPMESEKGEKILDKERQVYSSINKGKTMSGVFYCIRKDKTKFAASITSSPIVLDGEIIGAVDIFRDITKEKEIDRAKTEFVSLASHQLRTPISAIKWYSEMLLDPGKTKVGKLNVKQKRYIHEIYHGNERMIKLINNLLSISRIELGKLAVNLVPVDLKGLAEEVIKEQKPEIVKRSQTVSVEQKGEIPRVYSDPTLLRMVVENLLSNAVKYTHEKGEIDFIIKKQGQNILFEAKDNGIGIPKAEQGRIFEKLFRSSNAMIVDKEGTGLGLYIVRAIINSLGGEIWFKSEQDKGTSFFFTLPIRLAPK